MTRRRWELGSCSDSSSWGGGRCLGRGLGLGFGKDCGCG